MCVREREREREREESHTEKLACIVENSAMSNCFGVVFGMVCEISAWTLGGFVGVRVCACAYMRVGVCNHPCMVRCLASVHMEECCLCAHECCLCAYESHQDNVLLGPVLASHNVVLHDVSLHERDPLNLAPGSAA